MSSGGNVLRISSHRLGRPDFMERHEEEEVGAEWCGGMKRHSQGDRTFESHSSQISHLKSFRVSHDI